MQLKTPTHNKATSTKLRAYTRHWRVVSDIQGELNSKWIHASANDHDVAEDAQLAVGTVRRFRQWGKGNGKMTYSYFHGPAFTTIIGIASALDLQLTLVPKKRNGK